MDNENASAEGGYPKAHGEGGGGGRGGTARQPLKKTSNQVRRT